MFNPVRKYPRNAPCFCKSGDKFKNCCYGKQPLTVALDEKSLDAAKTIRILREVRKHQKAR